MILTINDLIVLTWIIEYFIIRSALVLIAERVEAK
jgi:hypothetical protein